MCSTSAPDFLSKTFCHYSLMATAGFSGSIAAKFDTARRDFLRELSDEEAEACSKFTSIDDVYDATDDIQKKQGETRTLQNLGKIQPYLECLNQYSGVLDTVVQIKPSVLAIIWVSSYGTLS
ncbi:MAG: hypothetical protein Q9214_000892 [Letrouitia sp. 1 TL-2023]